MIRQDQLAHYYMQQMNMKNLGFYTFAFMQATEPLRPKYILTKCTEFALT